MTIQQLIANAIDQAYVNPDFNFADPDNQFQLAGKIMDITDGNGGAQCATCNRKNAVNNLGLCKFCDYGND